MKKTLLTLSFLITSISLFAQSYDEKLASLQKEVWDAPSAEFKVTAIPDSLKKESAVVIARSINQEKGAGFSKRVGTSTWHERVKINDKVALEKFSTLEYQKRVSKATGFLRSRNKKDVYLGVKIIKPDGREIIIPATEEIILKNDNDKNLEGKLAVPGLQVGDIIDYFTTMLNSSPMSVTDQETFRNNDRLLMLVDEYPVLSYDMHFKFSSGYTVLVVYGNGAPHFEKAEKDKIYNLKLTNLPKYQGQVWSSPLRQYPYIEIGSAANDNVLNYSKSDNPAFNHSKIAFEDAFSEYAFKDFDAPEKQLKAYFENNKGLKNAPKDSVAKAIYDIWKYNTFCTYTADDVDDDANLNNRMANSRYQTVVMCMMLTDLKIDHDVILVASRNSNTLENTFGVDDLNPFIRINLGNGKYNYMFFDDVTTHFNEIPARFQGEKVLVLHPKRKSVLKYEFTESSDALPITTIAQNSHIEQLNVSLLPDNMQKIKIQRTVIQNGNMRHDDQRELLPYNDVDNFNTKAAKGDDLKKRLSKVSGTKKMYDAFESAFNDSKTRMTKTFTEGIKSQYDQEPEQVSNCKIAASALDDNADTFEYSSDFVLNNYVKKAGSNYIVDAGKLTGGFLKLDEKDRTRKIDIYMPSARTFTYTISINIPKGYAVKGVEELNKDKENKTGIFLSTALVSGNVLKIKVTRTYYSNFEKATDWPSLTEIIDAASEFNNKQVLFEKQG